MNKLTFDVKYLFSIDTTRFAKHIRCIYFVSTGAATTIVSFYRWFSPPILGDFIEISACHRSWAIADIVCFSVIPIYIRPATASLMEACNLAGRHQLVLAQLQF